MSLLAASDAKNTTPNSCLTTHGNKGAQLSVVKDVTIMYQSSLLEKEQILRKEKQMLAELNNRATSLKDSYRDQMWQFSRKFHDSSGIFKNCPFIEKIDHCKTQRNNRLHDVVERISKLMDLINEIDAIKAEIFNFNRGRNLKRDVENALAKLKKLQSISDKVIELLRLISSREHSGDMITTPISMPVYDEVIPNHRDKIARRKNDSNEKLKNKKARGNNNKEPSLGHKSRLTNKSNTAVNKKKLTTILRNYPQLSLEKTVVFSAKAGSTILKTQQ